MGERSGERDGSRRSLRRLARRQAGRALPRRPRAAAHHCGRAGRDRRPHPARRDRRLHQRDGAGPCADGHGLAGPWEVAVSPDGKSVYAASFGSHAVARFNRNTTTGAIGQPAGAAGCISDTGAGPCADGHGLDFAEGVAVSPDGKSVYVASDDEGGGGGVARFNRTTTTGAITQPAGGRRLRQRGGGGTPAPTAMRCSTGRPRAWRSARTGRASTSPRTSAAPWRASTATRRPGRSPSPPGRPAASARTGAEPCADGHGLDGATAGGGEPGREERLRLARSIATPWPASTATRPPGRSASPPAGAAGLPQRDRGRGPAPTATGSAAPCGGGGQPGREERLRRLRRPATPWRASTATRPPGRSPSPPATAGCVSQTGAGPCADGHALVRARSAWR